MTEYIVSTLSDKGNEIVVKRTDNAIRTRSAKS